MGNFRFLPFFAVLSFAGKNDNCRNHPPATLMIRIDCRGVSTDDLANATEIRAAHDCFIRHGYAILDNVVSEERTRELLAEFNERYAQYLHDQEAADSLAVGARRFMFPLRFSGGFGDPLVYANPFVVALVRAVLDPDAILEAFGAIVSLSGSEVQHIHRDGPHLFSSEISTLLPAHALTFALPLVAMNDVHGTTALWPGSHRWKALNEGILPEHPTIEPGSCMLWDFRLFHSGTENRSERPRPMVYATYARRWYQDPVNFKKEALQRLVFDPGFLQSVPEDMRPLFAHVR